MYTEEKHHNEQELRKYQLYTQGYSQFGRKLVDIPLTNTFFNLVSSFLPHHYKAVDLGCNDLRDITTIQKLCSQMGKEGKFLAVDPYSKNEGVITMTSQQFISDSQNNNFDAIVAKYSIHFNVNQRQFFENAYNRLKENGQLFILTTSGNSKIPWTTPINQTFIESVFHEKMIATDLFEYEKMEEINQFELDRQVFIEIVRRRSWSNILGNTQQEVSECVALLESKTEKTLPLKMITQLYVLKKKKQQ